MGEKPTVQQIYDSITYELQEKIDFGGKVISNQTNPYEFGADSLDIVEALLPLEERYNIHFSAQEVGQTGGAIGNFVELAALKLDVAMTVADREKYGNPDRPRAATIVGEIITIDKLEIEGRN